MQIVVQAGGRGSRLRHYTWNTPKCLVSVKGKPLLYHLFDRFPEHEFIIIGDYLFHVLEDYLKTIPPKVHYKLIKASHSGTASGIKQALKFIKGSFWLTWGDLIIDDIPDIVSNKVTVATTSSFSCRWSVQDGLLKEVESSKTGVPGLFYFPSPQVLKDIPEQGEFVRWLSKSGIEYRDKPVQNMEEYGEYSKVDSFNDKVSCRFFNSVEITPLHVIKKSVVKEYDHLIKKEQNWYKEISRLGYKRIPSIISNDPYTLEKINGNHPYEINYTSEDKSKILIDYLQGLSELHSLGQKPADLNDVFQVYIKKTRERVNSVKNLIPNFDKKNIVVNGKKVKNIFHDSEDNWDAIYRILKPEIFTPIHGDPHFSNTIVDNNLKVHFIDPRGYFYQEGIWGDPLYDYAKVYYSAIGNFDDLNKKKLRLYYDSETVEIIMEESKFKKEAEIIFAERFGDLRKINLLHGLIWLALCGYIKDSIDGIIASFYLGLYWIDEGLK